MADINEAALERLTRAAMASGIAWLMDNHDAVYAGGDQTLADLLGDWPAEFLSLRPRLVAELTEPTDA